MGIYTNHAFSGYSSSDYTSVEPFVGEHFNYHELGIIAAAESAANQNAFMKAIALQELASMEQYGNTDVLYESVNIKGIFEKIKAFFKKIIEKIHKIFHTFIAKMSSWFGNNKDFAKKYEKEVIKNWGLVSNDWEFKGYKYTHLPNLSTSDATTTFKTKFKGSSGKIVDILNADNTALANALKAVAKKDDGSGGTTGAEANDISAVRDKLDGIKDGIRQTTITAINGGTINSMGAAEFSIDVQKGLDSKEFTEELFKVFRDGQDSKQDMKKNDITGAYGNSINGLMTCIKDYDKIKTNLEKTENAMVKSIDEMVNAIDKAEDSLVKVNNDSNTDDTTKVNNEKIVSAASLVQSIWGFIKEVQTQAFSAALQATKDQCTQAKEIAVKVIGLNKKMTESADYSNDGNTTSTAFGGDFISSVKLV